mmetsp:Transcript_4674/g.6638  ORF Transcript_4674/g.6638 Transcript_4674/m.6638 type:complete len:102 (+) Transcript_4674:99-404(+)
MSDKNITYVKLISAEGKEIYLDKNIAISGSATMKAMLEGNFKESNDNVIHFQDITGRILEKIVQYLHYKSQNNKCKGRIPEFSIEPEIALELLVAASYLDC